MTSHYQILYNYFDSNRTITRFLASDTPPCRSGICSTIFPFFWIDVHEWQHLVISKHICHRPSARNTFSVVISNIFGKKTEYHCNISVGSITGTAKNEVFIWRHVVYVPKSSTTFRGILICVIFRPRDMQKYYMLFGIFASDVCLYSLEVEFVVFSLSFELMFMNDNI
jgi:hypothetical protein